jgi:hypothetical protein
MCCHCWSLQTGTSLAYKHAFVAPHLSEHVVHLGLVPLHRAGGELGQKRQHVVQAKADKENRHADDDELPKCYGLGHSTEDSDQS